MPRWIIACFVLMTLAACDANPESTVAYTNLADSGDSENGAILFTAQACSGCHIEGATGAPNLADFADRAGTTVDGQSAQEYAFYSIVEPARHIAEGYGNAMPNNYDESMTSQEIADLIAYLLDL